MVVVPTPPLGLNTVTSRCRLDVADRRDAGPDLRPLGAQRQGLDAGHELGLVEGRAMTSSAPASSRRDPLVEVAGGCDGEDRDLDRRARGRSIVTTSATVTGGATWSIITRL